MLLFIKGYLFNLMKMVGLYTAVFTFKFAELANIITGGNYNE